MTRRVLWLSKGLGPGGAERLLVGMAAAIDRDRFDVTAAYVLPWKDHLASELEREGVRTTCLSKRRHDPLWPIRLRAAMDGQDIVHSHSPVPAIAARLLSLTLPRSRRPVLMATEHNTWTSHHPLTRWTNRLTSGLDRCTLAVTAEAAESLRGSAAKRVEVLTHGVDVAAIAERRAVGPAVRRSLGIGADELVIGTVANYRAQKDYPNLLAAARRMVDDGVSFRLVAVGQGPDEAEVVATRDDLGLEEHVLLTGYRPDAVDVMAACDVFVLASAWEGQPVAVMEALALRLPVVATHVGGLAESLDASCAVLVPQRDPAALATALTELVHAPTRRSELASGARRAADRFDVGHATTAITERYLAVTEPRREARRSVDVHAAAPGRAVRRDRPTPDIRPMTDDDTGGVLELLGASLGWGDDERYRSLFEWKHRSNPFGQSPGWVAVDAGEIVAVRLFMRWRFRRGAEIVRAVRAVDTATRPDHQGRGLFTALTQEALAACRSDGIAFVFNTPNAQSRPGYLKMGWRDVGRPPVAIRPTSIAAFRSIAGSRVPADRWSVPIEAGVDIEEWLSGSELVESEELPVSTTDRTLRTDRTEEFLRWRYGMADLHYRVVEREGAAVIVRLRRRGDALELVVADSFGPRGRCDQVAGEVAGEVSATHAIRLGPADLRHRFVAVPTLGPDVTWRAVTDLGQPPLPNWDLRLGDIELF